jgi:hypothetical protein
VDDVANQAENIEFYHKSSNGCPTKCTNASCHDQQPNVILALQKWVYKDYWEECKINHY